MIKIFLISGQLLAAEIRKLQECAEAVEYKVWYYEKAKEAGTISVHNAMKREDIPERMQIIRSRMSHVERLIPPKQNT